MQRLLQSAKSAGDGALSHPEQRLLAIACQLFVPAMQQAMFQLEVKDLSAAPNEFFLATVRNALQMAAAIDDPLRDLRQAMEDC